MDSLSNEPLILTQKHYQGFSVEGKIFERSDISNCTVKELRFRNCCFNRSSLLGILSQQCVFEECQFKNIDLSSCTLKDCTFKQCDFTLADISDNVVFHCRFEETNFTGATLKENEFTETELIYTSLRGSLTSLNIFRKINVVDSEFGNCTIDYNIFEKCFFHHSLLNIETLGASFGLNLDDLETCQLLILGRKILEEDRAAVIRQARSYFEGNGHYFECFMIDLNCSLNSLIPGVKQLTTNMRARLLSGSCIPPNQLSFLFQVFKELYRRGQLGYIALQQLRSDILEILNALSPETRSYEKLILLYNNLNLLHNSMIVDLEMISGQEFPMKDKIITVRFTFADKPSVPIINLLESCHLFVFERVPEQLPIILSEKTGSYIVWIQTTIYTLLAFRICTYLLVGSVKELVRLRANTSLLVSKKLPRKYYLEVTKPETSVTIPQALAALLTALMKKALPTWLSEFPIKDLSKENLREIAAEVREGEGAKDN